jgi:hypothetical protein
MDKSISEQTETRLTADTAHEMLIELQDIINSGLDTIQMMEAIESSVWAWAGGQ